MSTIHMYLELQKVCPLGALFDVPHEPEPMSAKEIARKFPTFAREMDGSAIENTLSFFYKRNKKSKVYEVVDPESEEDVAELMGVQLFDESTATDTNRPPDRALTEEEKAEFREHIADIRDLLAKAEETEQPSGACGHRDSLSRSRESTLVDCSG